MTNEEIKGMLYTLHHSTFRNEKQIQGSTNCGCFYCKSIYPASEVNEWCDNDGRVIRLRYAQNLALTPYLEMPHLWNLHQN